MYGPYNEPACSLVYGDPSSGKTSDAERAFAGRAFHVGLPGGFKSYHNLLGLAPDPKSFYPCETIQQATQAVTAVGAKAKHKYIAVITDDISVMATRSYHLSEKMFPANKTFQRWEYLKGLLSDFTAAARFCGLYLVATGHKAPPGQDSHNNFVKGGPTMPGKQIQATVAHLFDLALRTVPYPEPAFAWNTGYHCKNNDANWSEKDRHHCLPSIVVPQNLGEILRLAGYPIPRPAGLEWMENVVDDLARKLAEPDANFAVIAKPLVGKLDAAGQARATISWVLYDAWSRSVLRYQPRRDADTFLADLLSGPEKAPENELL